MDAFITYRKTLTFPDTVQGTPLDMSAAHFGKLISFLTASKRHTCYLHGNEPALHPELPRLVAMARKKKILPFVATSGLMSETVKKLILEAQIPLLWKLYHPQFYDETQWQTMAENCVRLRSALPDRFRLAVIFHDPAQDYSHIPEFVHRAGVGDVSLRVLRADEPRRFEDFVARLVALVVSLTEAGVHVGLDCGLPPCFLSDEQFGALAKIDRLSKRCVPHPGVLPDLRVYHCPEMIDDASANFLRFRRRTEVIDHFYKRYSGLERDSELFEECPQCTARRRDTCHGRCMAVKRTVAVGDVERLWDAFLAGRILGKELVGLFVQEHADTAQPEHDTFYGYGVWLCRERGKPASPYIRGGDAGVSFNSRIDTVSDTIATVISNTGNGAWPLLKACDQLLA